MCSFSDVKSSSSRSFFCAGCSVAAGIFKYFLALIINECMEPGKENLCDAQSTVIRLTRAKCAAGWTIRCDMG